MAGKLIDTIMTSSVTIMTLVTLLLLVLNCCKFLWSKKTRRALIVLFYGFAFSNVAIVNLS